MPISATMTMPIQYALKFPAVRPDRMFSDGPPSRDEVTTSRTWPDSVDVKTLTSSGMMAPASVPQLMMLDSFHHSVVSFDGPRLGISRYETMYVVTTDTIDVTHTSWVNGFSKFMWSALA